MNTIVTDITAFATLNPWSTFFALLVVGAGAVAVFQTFMVDLYKNAAVTAFLTVCFGGVFLLFVRPLTAWVDTNAFIFWLACGVYVIGIERAMRFGHAHKDVKGLGFIRDFLPF
jgi:hypothetical protein